MRSAGYFLFTLLCLVAPALGTVNIGDTPQIQFTAADGSDVDLAKLKGKIVIVDMWATWCGPCMEEAPHMVQINQKYGDKGLQIIGISLDQDKPTMLSVAKEKGFTWPQYFDGMVWQNKYAVEYAVTGIPFTMLIGPDGKVLWTGHPALLDAPLEDAFKNHPPQLVDPAVLQSAESVLSEVNEKLAARDPKGAIALLAKIPPAAMADPNFAENAAAAQSNVQDVAEKMLAEVPPMIDGKQYVQAISRLKQLVGGLSGTSAGDKAMKMLDDLRKNPDAAKALAEAQTEGEAEAALAQAQKLQGLKKDDLAYPRFKQIVAQFPGTDAATTAAAAVAAYEQDAALMARLNAADTARKAKALLSMAETYRGSGESDLATKKYQQVIAEFPGTQYATTAQQALDDLAKQ
jgi:thiol-disulfide isomerase/thioredoxin/TolA-binding protein